MLVIDGNMKNRRDVCAASEAGFTEYEGLPGLRLVFSYHLGTSPNTATNMPQESAKEHLKKTTRMSVVEKAL